MKKVGILATGNEIVDGDILNTNAQRISAELFEHHITTAYHISVSDDEGDMRQALAYLLEHCDAIITTGGLGPTSDDRTRYAIADMLGRELIFDDHSWEALVARIYRLCGHKDIPENNRQQALFPEHATIFPNEHGSANGCMLEDKGTLIFMLPGPPNECLPMFHHFVMPELMKAQYSHTTFYKKWLLFNVSEGEIADKLDRLTEHLARTTGYRICYPYLEFKLFCENEDDFTTLVPLIEKEIAPLQVGDGQRTASDQLKEVLLANNISLTIDDQALGGKVLQTLLDPATYSLLHHENPTWSIQLTGMEAYWEQCPSKTASLHLKLIHAEGSHEKEITIPNRGERSLKYAVETLCGKLLQYS